MKISTRAGGTEDLAVCILAVWGQDVYWGAKPRLVRRVIAGMRVFCAPEALGKGGSFNSALHSPTVDLTSFADTPYMLASF